MLSGWIKQSRLDLPPLVIVLQRYLRELQAIEAEQPISASITEFRKQCRPLVKEQAQRARVGLPASHIDQLFDEIQALLRSWGPDYYEDSRKTLERAIALRADPWSKVEQKRQLNELMRLIYRQQQTRKDHEPLSLWSDVTNHLRQNGLNLEADEIILLCYFQAIDAIENEEQFQLSMAGMRKRCYQMIKEKALLLANGLKSALLYQDIVKTLEERHLDAAYDDYQLLNQQEQELASAALRSLSEDDHLKRPTSCSSIDSTLSLSVGS